MSSPHYPPSAAVKPVPSSPTLPSSSSNSPSPSQKADQIAYRIFVKLVNVVADARISPYSTFTSQSSGPHDTEDTFELDSPGGPAGSSSDRSERAGRKDSKNDKWFNLETPDFEQFKPDLAVFKSLSALNQVPSLCVNVLLSIPTTSSTQTAGPHHGLSAAEVLVHHFPRASSPDRDHVTSNTRVTRVAPAPRFILLEVHTLSSSGESMLSSGSVELPQVYKQSISLFRSLYTLLRILPSWKLQRRFRRSRGTTSSSNLGIEIRLSIGKPLDADDDIIAGFGAPHSQPAESLTSESIAFPPIMTPLGSFTMRTVHRLHPYYALEPLESHLSNHFFSPSPLTSEYRRESLTNPSAAPRREPVQFTPTLTSALERQRRESSASSPRSPLPSVPLPLPIPERARPLPIRSDVDLVSNRGGGDASLLGSLPVRTSLPQSLPSGSAPISMPVRNQPPSLANASPSSSLSSSPRPRRTSALGSVSSQGIDFPGPSGLGGGAASNSSPRFGFLHGREPSDLPFAVGLGSGRTSGVMERTRKESLLGSSGDRVSTPPLHGRRPSINSIHPFKSATISSSPSSTSYRNPLPVQTASASNPFVPVPGTNPSATALPSTMDVKRSSIVSSEQSSAVGGGAAIRPTPRSPDRPLLQLPSGRYSSSFGNRPGSLATGGGISSGSGDTSLGSGDRGMSKIAQIGASGSPSNEPLLNPTDDDDISEFVKAIDTRAPLRGGVDEGDRERDDAVEFPKYGKTPPELPLQPRGTPLSTPPSPLGPPRVVDDHRRHSTDVPHAVGSRADVDETLRRMTESFRAGFGSLEGGLRSRRRRAESASSALGSGGDKGGSRTSPLFEDDNASSRSGSPSGGRPARILNNMSSSSLFAGGRRSYDSGEQIVGRMDLTEEEDVRRSLRARPSDTTGMREELDVLQEVPFARPSRNH